MRGGAKQEKLRQGRGGLKIASVSSALSHPSSREQWTRGGNVSTGHGSLTNGYRERKRQARQIPRRLKQLREPNPAASAMPRRAEVSSSVSPSWCWRGAGRGASPSPPSPPPSPQPSPSSSPARRRTDHSIVLDLVSSCLAMAVCGFRRRTEQRRDRRALALARSGKRRWKLPRRLRDTFPPPSAGLEIIPRQPATAVVC